MNRKQFATRKFLLLTMMLCPPTAQQAPILAQHRHLHSKVKRDFILTLNLFSIESSRPGCEKDRPASFEPPGIRPVGSGADQEGSLRPGTRSPPKTIPSMKSSAVLISLPLGHNNIPSLDGVPIRPKSAHNKMRAENELLLSQRTKEE